MPSLSLGLARQVPTRRRNGGRGENHISRRIMSHAFPFLVMDSNLLFFLCGTTAHSFPGPFCYFM